jgi:hypothetical protein
MEISFADIVVEVMMTKNLSGKLQVAYGKSIPFTSNFFDPDGNAGQVQGAQINVIYTKNGQPANELINFLAPTPPDFQWRASWLSANADPVTQVVQYSVIAKYADGTCSTEHNQFSLVT